MTDKLKYPIGEFDCPDAINSDHINSWIERIKALPEKMESAILQLNDVQLDTVYRPGGWTLRQVVHHVADSHMNSYIRFKLAITEDTPTIRGYFEDRWAELPEAKNGDPGISISLLKALHERWSATLIAMNSSDFDKSFYHPEMDREVPLKEAVGLYAWHSDHHLAHITETRKKHGW